VAARCGQGCVRQSTPPKVHPEAFIAPTAALIADVTVEAGASVWFNAVVRADYAGVVIREGANVQDGSVLHAPPGIPTDIGPGAPAKVKGPIAGTGAEMWVNVNPGEYQALARRYRDGLRGVTTES
jgi:carbonic anhydrase/acetyltransferase-like protein (isoleucine patch superfamily)